MPEIYLYRKCGRATQHVKTSFSEGISVIISDSTATRVMGGLLDGLEHATGGLFSKGLQVLGGSGEDGEGMYYKCTECAFLSERDAKGEEIIKSWKPR